MTNYNNEGHLKNAAIKLGDFGVATFINDESRLSFNSADLRHLSDPSNILSQSLSSSSSHPFNPLSNPLSSSYNSNSNFSNNINNNYFNSNNNNNNNNINNSFNNNNNFNHYYNNNLHHQNNQNNYHNNNNNNLQSSSVPAISQLSSAPIAIANAPSSNAAKMSPFEIVPPSPLPSFDDKRASCLLFSFINIYFNNYEK